MTAASVEAVISIHAPAKGATQGNTNSFITKADFNPRTREGCDAVPLRFLSAFEISIHAPAKGATAAFRK